MTEYTYLLVNFFTVIIPLLFSFHPRLRFYKAWRAFFPAVILSGLVFIVWDAYFTSIGVWGFNDQYLTGIRIGNLPVEEVLFFFCIPYACVFTFYCLSLLLKIDMAQKWEDRVTWVLVSVLFIFGLVYYQRVYTVTTFWGLMILLLFTRHMLKARWLGRFYIVYALLLLPFLIVNGVLTGSGLESPVVWYNESEIMGYRIGTIPVEDVFYGMGLILLNLLIFLPLLEKLKPELRRELVIHSKQL